MTDPRTAADGLRWAASEAEKRRHVYQIECDAAKSRGRRSAAERWAGRAQAAVAMRNVFAAEAARLEALDTRAAHAEAKADESEQGSLCIEHGPNVSVDEDGCCVTCGMDAMWFTSNEQVIRQQAYEYVTEINGHAEARAAELTDHDHENIGSVGTNRVWPDLPEPGELIAASRQFVADLEACDPPLTVTRKAKP